MSPVDAPTLSQRHGMRGWKPLKLKVQMKEHTNLEYKSLKKDMFYYTEEEIEAAIV